jgi:hypothetical protein
MRTIVTRDFTALYYLSRILSVLVAVEGQEDIGERLLPQDRHTSPCGAIGSSKCTTFLCRNREADMRSAKNLALVGMLFLLLPVGLEAAVAVQCAKSVDFSQYRTFAWRQGTPALDPEVEKMIRDSIQRQLLAKGLTRVEGEADLLVSTHARVGTETREDVDILDMPQRWAGESESTGTSGEYLREFDVGTLVVDMLDGNSRLNVWRGIATNVLSSHSKTSQKRIDKAARKMFESFPTEAN